MKKRYFLLAFLVAVLLIGYFGFDFWVNAAVRTAIEPSDDSRYNIEFDHVKLDLFRRELAVYGFHIKNTSETPGVQVNLSVSEARMDSIDPRELLLNRSLVIASLIFENPAIEIYGKPEVKDELPARRGLQGLFESILKSGAVKNFEIRNGSLDIWRNREKSGNADGKVQGFYLVAEGIASDEKQAAGIVPFKVEKIKQYFDQAVYYLPNGQKLTIDSLKVIADDRKVEVERIKLAYLKSWNQVADSLGYQTDIIDVELGPLVLERIDVGSNLYEHGEFIAGHLKIENLDLTVHRDKRKPLKHLNEQEKYNFLANDLGLKMSIDSIELIQGRVRYIEMGEKRSKPATLPFNISKALLTHVTTIDSLQKEPLHITADASIGGHGHIHMDMLLPYDQPKLQVYSEVTDLDLTTLNSTLRDMVGVEIASGKLHRLTLRLNADGYYADNRLDFLYEDLNVVLLDQTKEHANTHFFLSAIANIAIKTRNLPETNSFRNAIYRTERDRTRAMFNLIWNSMREGLEIIVITKSAAQLQKTGSKLFHHKTAAEKEQKQQEHLNKKVQKKEKDQLFHHNEKSMAP